MQLMICSVLPIQSQKLEFANTKNGRKRLGAVEQVMIDIDSVGARRGAPASTSHSQPFLARFPIGCFGICLGLGSQAILWKKLAAAPSMSFLHVHGAINLALWWAALLALLLVTAIYALKCVLHAGVVKSEFCHPVRVNFFFAPWIAAMFLALGVPPSIAATSLHPALCLLFMTPLLALELKIYGQWISGGEKRLSRVANPSTHLSLVGNFVGALLAASSTGLRELSLFFWAVGLVHYLVLLVTLYQRLPSAAKLPKDLHPVYFLFIAAPSSASVAWSQIVGDFDVVAKIPYFVALFLYAALIVRLNLFRGCRFSVAWWAYTFPMTASAIATIHYSLTVTHPFTQSMALLLSLISSLTLVFLCFLTFLHAFFWRTLFPDDLINIVSSGGSIANHVNEYVQSSSCNRTEGQNDKQFQGLVTICAEVHRHISVQLLHSQLLPPYICSTGPSTSLVSKLRVAGPELLLNDHLRDTS